MGVSRLILLVAVLLMTCTGALLFLFPGVMLSLFTPDQAVIAQGAVVLRIIAVTEPIYAAGIIWEGVFNGVGDTRAPFVISMGTTWGVRILLTALCVHVFHLGPPGGVGLHGPGQHFPGGAAGRAVPGVALETRAEPVRRFMSPASPDTGFPGQSAGRSSAAG